MSTDAEVGKEVGPPKESQEQQEAEIIAAISGAPNQQDQGNALPSEILSEPLDEGVPGDTQAEWQDINNVLLSELESEPSEN
jgi:uncharacterized protein YrzB (UPF0473 family)